jgi:hypothetical protein
MGDPPALPGRQQKFDISESVPRLSIDEALGAGRQSTLWVQDDAMPPKYAKGDWFESVICLTYASGERGRNVGGQRLWAGRYFASAIE